MNRMDETFVSLALGRVVVTVLSDVHEVPDECAGLRTKPPAQNNWEILPRTMWHQTAAQRRLALDHFTTKVLFPYITVVLLSTRQCLLQLRFVPIFTRY